MGTPLRQLSCLRAFFAPTQPTPSRRPLLPTSLGPSQTDEQRSPLLNNLGILQHDENDYPAALQSHKEALRIRRTLVQTNPEAYLPKIANTLNNLGILQKQQNDYPAALQSFEEALTICRTLAQTNPNTPTGQTYLSGIALTLNNLGNLQTQQNDYPAALQSFEEALNTYQTLAQTNPATYLPYIANTLSNLGILQQEQNDYPAALQSYEEALTIRRTLAQTNAATYLPTIADTLNNLGVLQKEQNDYPAALRAYEECLTIRRALAKENPQVYTLDLTGTLINLSILYIASQPDKAQSLGYVAEAQALVQPFVEKNIHIAQQQAATLQDMVAYWEEEG